MSPSSIAKSNFAVAPLAPETSFKAKAYEALKDAITQIDVYASQAPVMLDERALSDSLGVSRTPIREALAMLEQDGFVRTMPRRGVVVVRKSKHEIVDMIRAWAALESMAARLIASEAKKTDIAELRVFFTDFGPGRLPQHHIAAYSDANIAFHQALISLAGSQVLIEMTGNVLLHVRGYRQMTIGREDRIAKSLPEHLAIIEALEQRDAARAETLARDHTLGLASYVDAYGDELFTKMPPALRADQKKGT